MIVGFVVSLGIYSVLIGILKVYNATLKIMGDFNQKNY